MLVQEYVRGDLVALERIFDPNAVVVESGQTYRGWPDYRDRHLVPELAAFTKRSLRFEDLDLHIAGGTAWVTCRFQFEGEWKEGPLSASGVATFVLERAAGLWRITHLHTSTAPAGPPPPGPGRSR